MVTKPGTFKITARDRQTRARSGVLNTARGDIRTPVFMPVGTQGSVKGVSSAELDDMGAQIILSNAYHLYLKPGTPVIRQAGGLHRFMSWPKPILTDSGGYQIFSLSAHNKVRAEGIEFRSHHDGSKHFLTPEEVVHIQHELGSDILMPLDECVSYPAEKTYVRKSVELTGGWAKRSKRAWEHAGQKNVYGAPSLLFGIVQGGTFKDLRVKAAREIVDMDFPGNSIGGLSVGEPSELMTEMLMATMPELPSEKPRYLMGLGLPADLFEAVGQGVDMFDCVVPTRNGRNATVFTRHGKLLLRGAAFIRDMGPIEEGCPCVACRTYSRAYLRHLFNAREHLAGRLASLHNLTFFIQLLEFMRQAIAENRFTEFRREFMRDYEADASPEIDP